ncbi:MAG: glutathione S-transferase family protein [Myxococcota bacterium]
MGPGTSIALASLSIALCGWSIGRARRRTHPVSGGPDDTRRVPYEQPYELYSNSFSHCSRKVRLALAELGIDYAHRQIDLIETGWYQTISPAYLKVNPAGLVPTLVHEGRPVYESDDILRYAHAVAPEGAPSLVPSEPDRRAQMERWISFCSISSVDGFAGMERSAGPCIPGLTFPMFAAAIHYVPLRNILPGFLYHPDKRRPALFLLCKLLGLDRVIRLRPIQERVRSSAMSMARHLRRLDRALIQSGGPWILGDDYTLADTTISCLLLRLDETGWLEQFYAAHGLAALREYYARLRARPSWTQAITTMSHPVVEAASADLAAARTRRDRRRSIYGS